MNVVNGMSDLAIHIEKPKRFRHSTMVEESKAVLRYSGQLPINLRSGGQVFRLREKMEINSYKFHRPEQR
jgi:hypothetical protein